jgi:hypothetical protein
MRRPRDFRHEPGRRAPRERRAAPRWAAANDPAELCWIDEGSLRRTSAVLMDISASGTLVLADALPPRGCRLLLRLCRTLQTGWVAAGLVEGHRTRFGPFLLRIAFDSRPSRHFLAAATAQPLGRN